MDPRGCRGGDPVLQVLYLPGTATARTLALVTGSLSLGFGGTTCTAPVGGGGRLCNFISANILPCPQCSPQGRTPRVSPRPLSPRAAVAKPCRCGAGIHLPSKDTKNPSCFLQSVALGEALYLQSFSSFCTLLPKAQPAPTSAQPSKRSPSRSVGDQT